MKEETEMGMLSQRMLRTASSHQKLEERHGTILAQNLQKEPALQKP